MANKRIERGTLYLAGKEDQVEVRPADGKKFSLKELQQAVGGYIQEMIPAVRHTTVWVNEEGALKPDFLPNRHTWVFASHNTYVVLNGYRPTWLVQGNALVVRKVSAEELERPITYGFPTIAEFLAGRDV